MYGFYLFYFIGPCRYFYQIIKSVQIKTLLRYNILNLSCCEQNIFFSTYAQFFFSLIKLVKGEQM